MKKYFANMELFIVIGHHRREFEKINHALMGLRSDNTWVSHLSLNDMAGSVMFTIGGERQLRNKPFNRFCIARKFIDEG